MKSPARHRLLKRENRPHLLIAALFIGGFLMFATPRVPHSPAHHLFADMRNTLGLHHQNPTHSPSLPLSSPPLSLFSGVPNTLNVLTSFPFLLIGVPGLVLCLSGSCFGISLKGEAWGWAFFYAGIAAAAFGSAYYHMRPDDDRVIWDRLPMMVAVSSLLSILVIERVDERVGISCLFSLLMLVLLCILYERTFDDLRLCITFHLIPFVAVPVMVALFSPKYTHSHYWFWAIGFYVLSRVEAIADKKIYNASRYIISGHSVEHLCLAMVPVMFTVMLWFRSVKISRDS